jgi:Mg-chelatase subunit ChlD
MSARDTRLQRWRLVLGESANDALPALAGVEAARDRALEWLYRHEHGLPDERGREIAAREGGDGASTLTVPAWLDEVHELFPRETIERLEQDAIERYQIHDVVTRADVLARVVPNETLLRAVLRTKHLMNEEVLQLARTLVARVVEQLLQTLQPEVRASFAGVVHRRRRSAVRSARNLDVWRTLKQNLHRFDAAHRRLVIERAHFFARVRRHGERWRVVLLVDQSGSMVQSVIHAAVTAACLWDVPGLRPHLVVFDTNVVDLTDAIVDPVQTLMKVQLGGGTDIGRAVAYGAQLVTAPKKTIVVVITDFYEGAPPERLVAEVRGLVEQGCRVLGLCALDRDARPAFDRDLAARVAAAGAHVGAMTPGELAGFIAEAMRR